MNVKKSLAIILSIVMSLTMPFQVQASSNTSGTKVISSSKTSLGSGSPDGLLPIESKRISQAEADKVPSYEDNFVSAFAISNNSYASTYGYNQLATATEKGIYSKLEVAYYAYDKSTANATPITYTGGTQGYIGVKIDLAGNEILASELYKVTVPFFYDHPDAFWCGGIAYSQNSQGYVTSVLMQCYDEFYNGSTRASSRTLINNKIKLYLDLVAGVQSDYEKELILHDELMKNLTYSYVNGQPSQVHSAHTIEGPFTTGLAVCEGYAKAFQLLMNACGIESIFIAGLGKGAGHGWNMVKIGGDWYNVDITWDDSPTDPAMKHDYFNKTSAIFNKADNKPADHAPNTPTSGTGINTWGYILPDCNATTYAYTPLNSYTPHKLTFTQATGSAITVENNGIEVASGTNVEKGTSLTVIATPDNQSLVYVASCKVNNSSSDTTMSLYTDSVTGKKSYRATVTMPDTDASIEVTIQGHAVAVTGLAIDKDTIQLSNIDEQATLIATVSPSDASNKNVIWTSSNTNIAIVSNGVVTAKGFGTATITAKSDDGSFTDTCAVNISNQFTVSFNTYGGSAVSPIPGVQGGSTVTLPTNPTNANYIFDGWYMDESFTKPFTASTVVMKDITVYAKWTQVALSSIEAAYSSEERLPVGTGVDRANIQVVAKYNDGTSKTLTANEFSISPSVITKEGSNIITVSYHSKTDTIVVYGKTSSSNPTTYTVSFVTNGGSSIDPIVGLTSGSTITLPANPTRASYVFGGWYTDSSLTTAFVATTPITASINLYAKWTATTDDTTKTVKSIKATYSGGNIVVGNSISKSNVTVTATYTDNTTANVNDFTLSTTQITTLGSNTIVATYRGMSASFTVTGITSNTTNVRYLTSVSANYFGSSIEVGSSVDRNYFTVIATYSDGTISYAYDFSLSNTTITNIGNNTIYVYYGGYSTSVNVTGVAKGTNTGSTVPTAPTTTSSVVSSTTTISVSTNKNGYLALISPKISVTTYSTFATINVEIDPNRFAESLKGKVINHDNVFELSLSGVTPQILTQLSKTTVNDVVVNVDLPVQYYGRNDIVIKTLPVDKITLEKAKYYDKKIVFNFVGTSYSESTGRTSYTKPFCSLLIDGAKLNDTQNINAGMGVTQLGKDYMIESAVNGYLKEADRGKGAVVTLTNTGELANIASMTVNLSSIMKKQKGDIVYVFGYNTKTKKLEELPKTNYKVDADQSITIPAGAYSKYVILSDATKKDVVSLASKVKVTDTMVIASGNSKTVHVTLPDGVDAKSATVSYDSSNTSKAYVSSKGIVYAKKAGKVTITTTVKIGSYSKSYDTTIVVR
jgi:uncharacterized repeat protein (TIGR02543 family)